MEAITNTIKDPNDDSNTVTDSDHNSQSARKTGKQQKPKNKNNSGNKLPYYLTAGIIISMILLLLFKLNRRYH